MKPKFAHRSIFFIVVAAVVLASVGALTGGAAPSPTAPIAGFTVTNTSDGGLGSLRQAITDANAAPGADTITITANGTISLNSALPPIAGDLTINGPGANNLRVRRRLNTDDTGMPSFTILSVNQNVTVSISGITISHGRGVLSNGAGGIFNAGKLTLNSCVVSDNLASKLGGGIHNSLSGTLTVNNCVITRNVSAGGSFDNGGGIVSRGQLTVNDSTISDNATSGGGGGVASEFSIAANAITLNRTTLSGNRSAQGGGGVYSDSGVSITDCVISGNTSEVGHGGGVHIADPGAALTVSTITNTTITNNTTEESHGGGLYSRGANNSVTISNSAITGNTILNDRYLGAGLMTYNTLTLVNTTVSGNSGRYGIYTQDFGARVFLDYSTVTNNRGGIGGTLRYSARASIIYGNTPNTGDVDVFATLASLDYNLFGKISEFVSVTGETAHDLVGVDPRLGPLGVYGGPVPVHPLLAGSPALDSAATSSAPATDARGLARPADGDGDGTNVADRGAFERRKHVVTNSNTGGAGSLRQALLDNNTAGYGLIAFNIPGPGLHTIAPTSTTPLEVTRPAFISGYTQPGAARNTLAEGDNATLLVEISGANAAGLIPGLNLAAGNSLVEGLIINRFSLHAGVSITGAGANRVSGNRIGTDADGAVRQPNSFGVSISNSANNVIGTDADGHNDFAERNLISGNSKHGVDVNGAGAAGNVIAGNYIGTNRDGSAALANTTEGIHMLGGAHDNRIGGVTPAARNVISGNGGNGISFESAATTANIIVGNYIGTNAAGASAVRNPVGIRLFNGANNRVGGAGAGERNVISGNGDGIVIGSDGARGNFVQGNFIGLAADGFSPLGNSGGPSAGQGIVINNSRDNVIGGAGAGAGNRIAHNATRGVYVVSGVGNALRGNAIFSNGALGLDLGATGPDGNDDGDADTGANNLQNSPGVVAARFDGARLALDVSFFSAPNAAFTLDFYANSACDASGLGEGETYLGSGAAATDANGNVNATLLLPVALDLLGKNITATATDGAGNTSEFSLCRAVTPANSSLQFTQGTYSATEGEQVATFTVTRTGSNAGAIAVGYATAPHTQNAATGGASCAAGVDYINATGSLSWASGDATPKTINVTLCNDLFTEDTELFRLSLSDPTGPAMLGAPNSTLLLIHDNDAPVTLQIDPATSNLNEKSAPATFTVTRSGGAEFPVSVKYQTAGGASNPAIGGTNCAAGVDYLAVAGTLTWEANDTAPKTIAITPCDDHVTETAETIILSLAEPTNATIGQQGAAVIAVNDDDDPGTAQFESANYTAGEESRAAVFTVTRTATDGPAVNVRYSTVGGGTATGGASCGAAGVDYINLDGALSWAEGEVGSKTFAVTLCDDDDADTDETINLALSEPTGGARLGAPQTAVLTITDGELSFVITNTNDAGAGSLREAITNANQSGATGAITITFAPGVTGAINLASELPYLNADITLAGPGADQLTIRRSAAQGTPEFRIFTVASGKEVTLAGLTISNGRVFDSLESGGGIYNNGALVLNDCRVTDNVAWFGGGGVYNAPGASLTVNESVVASNNVVTSGGGGIFSDASAEAPATLVVNRSRVTDNSSQASILGGGIYASHTTTTLSETTIANNTPVGSSSVGGGVAQERGELTLDRCTVSGNVAGSGGGLFIFAGALTLTDSTVSGNQVTGDGGGILALNSSVLTVTNSTISGNTANKGGGIHVNNSTLRLRHATLAANMARAGGGLYNPSFTPNRMFAASTIIAGNTATILAPDVYGLLTSEDYNLIGNATGDATIIAGTTSHDITGVDPRLDALAANGGATHTHSVRHGSPAIDAGGSVQGVATDQRGLPRPADGDGDGASAADIGAFETQRACSLELTPPTLSSGMVGAPYQQTFAAGGGSAPYVFALGGGVLPAGVSLSQDGALGGMPEQSGEFPITVTATDTNGCSGSRSYHLSVEEPAPACAVDATSSVAITRSGFSQNLVTKRFRQTVSIQNMTTTAMTGELTLALDNLSVNAALYNSAGLTSCAAPLGSAYANVSVGGDGLFTPGEIVTVTLEFTNSNTRQSITYTPRLLAGGGAR
jgi:hypothetical protein